GITTSRNKRRASRNQQDKISGPSLPMDIWCHIHSLMPMRDAAQVACVSRAFARSWRGRPNLTFSEETFGLNENTCQKDKLVRYFTNKAFNLEVYASYDEKNNCHLEHLDSWLQIAVKPGIEELILSLFGIIGAKYNFPCSLFADGAGESLQYLFLASCEFHPTTKFGCLKSLTRLQLYMVHIADGELECFLAGCVVVESLDLRYCSEIICLKIPCLQRLSFLEVSTCSNLEAIESKAPNLSSFDFAGDLDVKLSLGNSPQIKKLRMRCKDATYYACTELPSKMPNLESLTIDSPTETVNAPMLSSQFLHLKFLAIIVLDEMDYDFLSLGSSFFDASPSLETFFDASLQMMPRHHHDKLKRVDITNFTSARTLVELACHIVESAKSLVRLTLDTTKGGPRCFGGNPYSCSLIRSRDAILEAERAVQAVEMYIKPKVSSTVELNVVEPCNRCRATEL
uniref:Uncharacterized protein n=1 Tax=Setaria italica TaxID=4555 RepID=K3Z0V8_SETIT